MKNTIMPAVMKFYLCSCSWELQLYVYEHEAKCSLLIALPVAATSYITLTANNCF